MSDKERLEQLLHGWETNGFMDWLYEVCDFLDATGDCTSDMETDISQAKFFKSDIQKNGTSLLSQLKRLHKKKYENISLPVKHVVDQVFVAMWFADSMLPFWRDGFVPAIEAVGYKAVRIDEQQYDGAIIAQIMTEMVHSKAIVADLSGNRGGVYYEAGIARGLRLCGHPIRLILTCKSSDFDSGNGVHFDVRGYNCIVYDDAEDLKNKLLKRLREGGENA